MAIAFDKAKNKINSQELSNKVLPKLVFDHDTLEILHANYAIANILGYTDTELCRMKLTDLLADDFSSLVDNENVQFPAYKIVRQLINSNGNIINCLSENSQIDFDSSALVIYNAKYFVQSETNNCVNTDMLIDNTSNLTTQNDYSKN